MKLRNKKTGEIIDIDKIHFVFNDGYAPFSSLRILNAYWEDYKPKEPLIKDEKVRKAVRAWAEMYGIKKVIYGEYSWKDKMAWLEDAESTVRIGIPTIAELEDEKRYTIAELCGEEEEC